LLERHGLTLGVAESCTGGLVSELLTEVPGASRAFLGGAVAYANAAKSTLLGVEPELIAAHGAVSRDVARAMAEGVRARLRASLGLSITGIAGPDGGTPEKPVGLVHWAVAGDGEIATRDVVYAGDRAQIRRRAAFGALALVRRFIREHFAGNEQFPGSIA